jgi:hypothetical protein
MTPASGVPHHSRVIVLRAEKCIDHDKDEGTTMNNIGYFERLVLGVQRVGCHAYYPGIDQAINQYLEDINDLMRLGRITAEQREELRLLVLGVAGSAL